MYNINSSFLVAMYFFLSHAMKNTANRSGEQGSLMGEERVGNGILKMAATGINEKKIGNSGSYFSIEKAEAGTTMEEVGTGSIKYRRFRHPIPPPPPTLC